MQWDCAHCFLSGTPDRGEGLSSAASPAAATSLGRPSALNSASSRREDLAEKQQPAQNQTPRRSPAPAKAASRNQCPVGSQFPKLQVGRKYKILEIASFASTQEVLLVFDEPGAAEQMQKVVQMLQKLSDYSGKSVILFRIVAETKKKLIRNKEKRFMQGVFTFKIYIGSVCVCVFVCVFMCVCERASERARVCNCHL